MTWLLSSSLRWFYTAIDKLYDSESGLMLWTISWKKASVTIYFCLIKSHRGNTIEVMLKKASLLKKLLKNIQRKMVALPHGILQVLISLDCLSS